MAQKFSSVKLQKRAGEEYKEVSAVEQLQGKVVALYFSAHWCPPCRQFTPILKDFYEELDGKAFEIVFVSFDRSDADLKSYMKEAHGDWCVVPFGEAAIQDLAKTYDVSGIPALIIIKPNGDVVTKDGRANVQGGKQPSAVFDDWKKQCGV